MTSQVDEFDAPRTFRVQWVDVARGIGIILVVWGHVLRANVTLAMTPWAAAQERVIYAFHMPLFFVLAGLFLLRSVGKGRTEFLKGRWWSIIWPYLLWSLITGIIELAMARFVNSPISPSEVLLIPVVPIEQYWFLYALLVCQLVCLVAYPSKGRLYLLTIAGLIALKLLGGAWIGLRAFLYLPFVVAGVVLAGSLGRLSTGPRWKSAALAAGGFLAITATLWGSSVWGETYATFLTNGLAGSLGCLGSAMVLARSKVSKFLASLGQASLAIYVLHTLFSAGVRIALKLIGVAPASPLSLVGCLLLGLLLPWLAFRFLQRHKKTRAVGFGAA